MPRVRIYPHNDLLNLAHYHRNIINEKTAKEDNSALSLDCLSCLISLAFALEAIVNFVGHKKVRNWKERRPFIEKMKIVCCAGGVEFDKNEEPFRTLWHLKESRDSLAHGKPSEFHSNARNREELREEMQCPWDEHLTPEFINHAYLTVRDFKLNLLDKCEIPLGQTLTSSIRSNG